MIAYIAQYLSERRCLYCMGILDFLTKHVRLIGRHYRRRNSESFRLPRLCLW